MVDIVIFSLQQSKTITAGEGGAVVTCDPVLFERACRFHDVGGVRRGAPAKLGWLPGLNYRMNEFTGGVPARADPKAGHHYRRGACQCGPGLRRRPRSSGRPFPPPAGPGWGD